VPQRYDAIGRVYARHRAPAPRIAAQIHRALGAARSVVNVYLDPGVRASISAFAMLDDSLLTPGLARFADDLESGAWDARNADILECEVLDFGYRLIVT
jgi:hypothetical protein